MILHLTEQEIKDDFRNYLRESDLTKEKRLEAINISSDRKLSLSETYEFNFKFLEYKLDKGGYPVHPSAKLEGESELIIKSNKGPLETEFTYNIIVSDYLNSTANSSIKFEVKDLKEFKAFINDEEVKLDKGTAKKISSNLNSLKLNDKIIKENFKSSFDLYKNTNYNKIKEQIEQINSDNESFRKLQDIIDKSDEISKIVKKYNVPIQKIVYYKDILVIFDGYLNEKMRIRTKKLLDSYDTELWGINDTTRRKKAEDINDSVLKDLNAIHPGKMICKSKGEQIIKEF